MFDIVMVKESDPKKFGFDNFYFFDDIKAKIIVCENTAQMLKYKNEKKLLLIKNPEIDEGVTRLIAEKQKACILIDLREILNKHGVLRGINLSKIRNFLKVVNRYGAFYTFATFAETQEKIRTQEELISIIQLFEINKGQAKFALKMLKHYL